MKLYLIKIQRILSQVSRTEFFKIKRVLFRVLKILESHDAQTVCVCTYILCICPKKTKTTFSTLCEISKDLSIQASWNKIDLFVRDKE